MLTGTIKPRRHLGFATIYPFAREEVLILVSTATICTQWTYSSLICAASALFTSLQL
jgi:hypothetical protein